MCLYYIYIHMSRQPPSNPSRQNPDRQESEASYEDPEEAKLKVEAQASSNRIHGIGIFSSYIYIPQISAIHVGKYTVRPMDSMGLVFKLNFINPSQIITPISTIPGLG